MIVHGRNLKVNVGGSVIACARSCELSIDCDTIEVSSPSTGTWRNYIAGRKSWNVSVSALTSVVKDSTGTDNVKRALTAIGVEVLLTFEAKDNDGVYVQFAGTAIPNSSKISGTIGNLGQSSYTFQGAGELFDNSASVINCKGILPYQTGGTKSGYYLTYSTTAKVLNKLVLNILTNGRLTQYEVEPNATTQYVVGSDTYFWNGLSFAKIVAS